MPVFSFLGRTVYVTDLKKWWLKNLLDLQQLSYWPHMETVEVHLPCRTCPVSLFPVPSGKLSIQHRHHWNPHAHRQGRQHCCEDVQRDLYCLSRMLIPPWTYLGLFLSLYNTTRYFWIQSDRRKQQLFIIHHTLFWTLTLSCIYLAEWSETAASLKQRDHLQCLQDHENIWENKIAS